MITGCDTVFELFPPAFDELLPLWKGFLDLATKEELLLAEAPVGVCCFEEWLLT